LFLRYPIVLLRVTDLQRHRRKTIDLADDTVTRQHWADSGWCAGVD
jgi:hypothetical protein